MSWGPLEGSPRLLTEDITKMQRQAVACSSSHVTRLCPADPGTFLPIGWGGPHGTFLVVLRWTWVVRTVRDGRACAKRAGLTSKIEGFTSMSSSLKWRS